MEEITERGKGLREGLPSILFMGTPDFALPALEKLAAAGVPILAVVTQPDRPKGRGKKLTAPSVKSLAERLNLPVYQPARASDKEVMRRVRAYRAECAVVVAYGQILSKDFLELFPLGALNVHASLLPKYRGAAPIHRSILEGETVTGVSIMLLDPGMDTGPVLCRRETAIATDDTTGSLHDNLAHIGADLLLDALIAWKSGILKPCPQDEALATYAPPIHKQELKLNWHEPASAIVNRVRAFDPWPGAYTVIDGKRIKCFKASLLPWRGEGRPGEVLGKTESGLIVAAGDGQVVCLGGLQVEGQKRMLATDFLRGRPIQAGSCIG